MIVYIDYDPKEDCWFYYTVDSKGYKTKTNGFRVNMEAEKHVKERFKNETYTIKWR